MRVGSDAGSVPVRSDPTMSDDGAFVFFESPVALTPRALNDVPVGEGKLAENVYEYHEGQVSLISDGKDTTPEGKIPRSRRSNCSARTRRGRTCSSRPSTRWSRKTPTPSATTTTPTSAAKRSTGTRRNTQAARCPRHRCPAKAKNATPAPGRPRRPHARQRKLHRPRQPHPERSGARETEDGRPDPRRKARQGAEGMPSQTRQGQARQLRKGRAQGLRRQEGQQIQPTTTEGGTKSCESPALKLAPCGRARRLTFWMLRCVGLAVRARAAIASSRLTIHTLAIPTRFSEPDTERCLVAELHETACDYYQVTVTNTGSKAASGPITLTDALPAGVTVVPVALAVRLFWAKNGVRLEEQEAEPPEGPLYGPKPESLCNPAATPVTCEFSEPLQPDQRLEMKVYVTVAPGTVSADEHCERLRRRQTGRFGRRRRCGRIDRANVRGERVPRGHHGGRWHLRHPGGRSPATSSSTGSTSTRGWPNRRSKALSKPPACTELRDVVVDLPLGFLGSATSTTEVRVLAAAVVPGELSAGHAGRAPRDRAWRNAVGVNCPVYNMVPEHGVAAEFGFAISSTARM